MTFDMIEKAKADAIAEVNRAYADRGAQFNVDASNARIGVALAIEQVLKQFRASIKRIA